MEELIVLVLIQNPQTATLMAVLVIMVYSRTARKNSEVYITFTKVDGVPVIMKYFGAIRINANTLIVQHNS